MMHADDARHDDEQAATPQCTTMQAKTHHKQLTNELTCRRATQVPRVAARQQSAKARRSQRRAESCTCSAIANSTRSVNSHKR